MANSGDDSNYISTLHGSDKNGIIIGRWEDGLFQCFRHFVPNCFCSFICPCVSIAQISARIGFLSYWIVMLFSVIIFIGIIVVGLYAPDLWLLAIDICLWIVIAIFAFLLRYRVMKMFQIPQSSGYFNRILEYLCCCCSISQVATQCKSYEQGTCDIRPRDPLSGYQIV